ncbi:polyhydroxyalkanoate depolymerase [Erythrobacter litoralis]|uniref:polyhydroxyalkanoate depolymerase n=1 Tax=Erythrobacter litoralis TaxID=39960 RepID=UPI00243568E3|nr:polyhydroxyalkanoate depolymerase [Erythrobacter litoralis]MDG6080145.1 polyhydroxyalkanoate depolymerase [Erythrobacter litoralis]
MLYHAYELQRSWLSSASAWASIGAEMLSNPALPMGYMGVGPATASALEVFAHAAATRGKPAWNIETVAAGKKRWPVEEATVLNKPFGDLKRFTRDGLPDDAPSMLIVAPMSGHYATLLRGTVERMLENYVVYVTDWADAKTVPLSEGRFDLDDYIDYVIEYLELIGTGAHVMAVCQPSVPVFAATAIMNRDEHECAPRTLTMMGGPIDTRCSPTTVNDLAMDRPLAWFRQNVIATVPMQYRGAGRRVYPGFLQLASFMSMNLGSHLQSHYEMFKHLTEGDEESANATKDFYDEYRSVCDMTAEFYIQTVEEVFQKHSLPNGELMHRGKRIDLGDVDTTALLAIEGERDDISGLGQTRAALELTPNLDPSKKRYYMAEGAGHYGIFNGSKWRGKIAPVVEEFVAMHG